MSNVLHFKHWCKAVSIREKRNGCALSGLCAHSVQRELAVRACFNQERSSTMSQGRLIKIQNQNLFHRLLSASLPTLGQKTGSKKGKHGRSFTARGNPQNAAQRPPDGPQGCARAGNRAKAGPWKRWRKATKHGFRSAVLAKNCATTASWAELENNPSGDLAPQAQLKGNARRWR